MSEVTPLPEQSGDYFSMLVGTYTYSKAQLQAYGVAEYQRAIEDAARKIPHSIAEWQASKPMRGSGEEFIVMSIRTLKESK